MQKSEQLPGIRREVDRLGLDQLLSRALDQLALHWATRPIAVRASAGSYDRALGQRICELLLLKCGRDIAEFDRAVADLIAFSEEFVTLQIELDRVGHYRLASYEDARLAVYDNPDVMNHRYLNGLFLSTAFWKNHTLILEYFVAEFCGGLRQAGRMLEVPSGTGMYLSEFARRNAGWSATGLDISAAAVGYGRRIACLNGAPHAEIQQADVFALDERASFDRIVCGELLEHLERPEELLRKLATLIAPGGKVFLTTAIWAASLDHIYLFRSAAQVRTMIDEYFAIESEIVLNVFDNKAADDERTPINYACILTAPNRTAFGSVR